MTFENQLWLILTPAIVFIAAGLFAFGLRRREALLGRFAAARLLDQLTEKASHTRSLLKAGLILLAFALIGIALARPTYGVDWIERKARGLDIVFVLDSSKSMLATDLRPTRLERAKLAIMDLVQRLESDRIGLVAFAGNAFLQTPPTLDYSAFRENLESIGHDTITRGGSDLGQAIREAAKAFPQEHNFKVVILLTDGEDQAQAAIDTAREVAQDGINVYAIGIGTPEGVYLKTRNAQGSEEFIRDAQGQPVRSQLDEATLQQIAQLTGGSYSRLSDQSLNSLYNAVIATLPREERESELQEARIERFQWALAAACLLLVLEIFIRRRRTASIQIGAAWIACSLLAPTPAEAQQAPTPVAEQPATAIEYDAGTDPRVLYNDAYRRLEAGEYEQAKQLYARVIETSTDLQLERDALYNMAHATNQIGEAALQAQELQAAIEHWAEAEALFQSAHQIDPTDAASVEDAASTAARREALEALLEEQAPQDQQSSEDDEQQASDQPSEDSQQNDSQGQESGEQDESEQSQQPSADNQESNGEQSSDQPQDSEPESGQDGAESSESQSDTSDDSEAEQPDEQSGAESTADPAEDMEQQAQQQAASDGDTAEDEPVAEEGQSVQPSEGEPDDPADQQTGTMTVEGMSVSEAQALLDSLRDAEHLLPFSEPSDETSRSKHKGEIRDW
jgi:Ca-activated chloride channel family protein